MLNWKLLSRLPMLIGKTDTAKQKVENINFFFFDRKISLINAIDLHKQDCNLYFALGFSVAASSSIYISKSQIAWITIVLSESSIGRSLGRAETCLFTYITV